MPPLQQAINGWDGKSVQALEQIFQQHEVQPDFIDHLMALIWVANHPKAATWLLKKWLNSGKRLSQTQTNQLLTNLPKFTDWESKLHILQSLSYFTIENEHAVLVEVFLRSTLSDHNKFVRAWAYNGFYVLAKQYPAYQAEAQALFEMALRDESASIKARVRQVVKAGF